MNTLQQQDHTHFRPVAEGNDKWSNSWVKLAIDMQQLWSFNTFRIANNNLQLVAFSVTVCHRIDYRHFWLEVCTDVSKISCRTTKHININMLFMLVSKLQSWLSSSTYFKKHLWWQLAWHFLLDEWPLVNQLSVSKGTQCTDNNQHFWQRNQ